MTMYSKWGLIYLSNYGAAYLSHKQNKTTLEIQDIEHYTATSNLSFFTVLLPTVVWVVWQLEKYFLQNAFHLM